MKRFLSGIIFSLLFCVVAGCNPISSEEVVNIVTPSVQALIEVDTDVDQAFVDNAQNTQAAEVIVDEPTSIVLIDATGEEFRYEIPPQRIVSLAPSNTELLFAVGAADQIVGREEYSNYPPEAEEIPSIGSVRKLNAEIVVSLEPDLVLAADITAPEQIQALKDLGMQVFLLKNPESFEDLYQNIKTVGLLTGHQPEAEELVLDMQDRVDYVVEKVSDVDDKPLVFYELDATDVTSPWTAGAGTFIDTLIGMAGGRNVGAVLEGEWAQISAEELVRQNPDIIVLGSSKYGGVTSEDVVSRAGWGDIAAVKNSLVFEFDDDLVSRPGPRLVMGLEELAKIIQPDLFE